MRYSSFSLLSILLFTAIFLGACIRTQEASPPIVLELCKDKSGTQYYKDMDTILVEDSMHYWVKCLYYRRAVSRVQAWFIAQNNDTLLDSTKDTLTGNPLYFGSGVPGIQTIGKGAFFLKATATDSVLIKTIQLYINGRKPVLLNDKAITLIGDTVEGHFLQMKVSAAGSPPLQFLWYKDLKMFRMGTAADFLILSLQATDTGTYSCCVQNPFGGDCTRELPLPVVSPPRILENRIFSDGIPKIGNSFSLRVDVTGSGPLAYLWLKGNDTVKTSPMPGESLSLNPLSPAHAGIYSCAVINKTHNLTARSNPYTLAPEANLDNMKPFLFNDKKILLHGSPYLGAPCTLSVTSWKHTTVEWKKDGVAIPIVNCTVPFPALSHSDTGRYQCIVYNALGSDTSFTYTLRIMNPVPAVDTVFSRGTPDDGANFALYVKPKNCINARFLWFYLTPTGFKPITLQKTDSLPFKPLAPKDAAVYYCEVTNNYNGTPFARNSSMCTLRVIPKGQPPHMGNNKQLLVSGVMQLHSNLTLKAAVFGSAPMLYRWYKGDDKITQWVNIPCQNFFSLQLSDTGSYRCIVSNPFGIDTSTSTSIHLMGNHR